MKKVIDEAVDLLRVVERFDIEELELEVKGLRFHISRGGAPIVEPLPLPSLPSVPLAPPPPAHEPEPEETPANSVPITSPMVGMFYRSSSPDKPPFIDAGQIVEMDQPVCIIEAMKLMNEIKSEVAGRITDVLLQTGEAVEFGQPLFSVEPPG